MTIEDDESSVVDEGVCLAYTPEVDTTTPPPGSANVFVNVSRVKSFL